MIVLDASALVDVVADRPAKDAVLAQMEGEYIIAPYPVTTWPAAVSPRRGSAG